MNVLLNGDPLEIPTACTVAQLLDLQQLTLRRVAVEVNGEIIPRGEHASTVLNDGDQIEIVHALGGG